MRVQKLGSTSCKRVIVKEEEDPRLIKQSTINWEWFPNAAEIVFESIKGSNDAVPSIDNSRSINTMFEELVLSA